MVAFSKKGTLYSLNSENIALRNHSNMFNEYLEKGCAFSNEFKSYEKTKEDILTFICFDIEIFFKKNGLILQTLKYQGNLVFTFSKLDNKIVIKKLPRFDVEKNNISIFTSDILSIILDKLENYLDKSNLFITFENTYQKLAIDNNLKKLLPQIEQNLNYKRMCLIYRQMNLEEEQIKKEILREKIRKEKEEAIKERVIAKKSIIYGIDEREYENYLNYLNDVNRKICEVCEYKIANIKRHMEANKKIYIALLKKNDKTHKLLKNILENIYEGYGWAEYDSYCSEEVFKVIENHLENTSEKPKITEELLEFYYEATFKYDSDTSIKESLISLLQNIRKERLWDEGRYDGTGPYGKGRRPAKPNDIYNFILGIKDYYGGEKEIINYKNPIFQRDRIVQKDFKKCVDILFQIAGLKKQLSYYENIRTNPNKSLLNFQSNSNSWNSILNFPYWLRLGRDTSKKDVDYGRETFHLLMIKPGVKKIDFNNIRIFTRNNGQEFGSTKIERQQFLESIVKNNIGHLHCDRLMITIPKSLEFDSIIKLIDYAHFYGKDVQFICENSDISVLLKEILVDRVISAYKQVSIEEAGYHFVVWYKKVRNRYFQNRCFICVDPYYFSNFMLDTPTNKNFWHRYDYTGNYKFRRHEPASFDYVINRTIYENTHDSIIDYERINKQLLGSYSSKEPIVEPVSINLIDFIGPEEYYRLHEWFPECKGLDFDALNSYVENRFSNRFYLDYNTCNKLYVSNYNEESDYQNEGEVYTKKLERRIDNDLPFNE